MTIIGEEEMDTCFKAMNGYSGVKGLRHFKKRIYFVSQWIGREHKEMQRTFVGLMAGAENDEVLTVIRAAIDFTFSQNSTPTLQKLLHCFKNPSKPFTDTNMSLLNLVFMIV